VPHCGRSCVLSCWRRHGESWTGSDAFSKAVRVPCSAGRATHTASTVHQCDRAGGSHDRRPTMHTCSSSISASPPQRRLPSRHHPGCKACVPARPSPRASIQLIGSTARGRQRCSVLTVHTHIHAHTRVSHHGGRWGTARVARAPGRGRRAHGRACMCGRVAMALTDGSRAATPSQLHHKRRC
jgi:hypothetical protein